MDYDIYCKASKLWASGGNPYDLGQLKVLTGHDFPFRYLPLTLPFFWLICHLNHYILYSILIILICLIVKLVDKQFKFGLFLAILSTAFMATFSNYTTGNMGLVDLLILSCVFLSLSYKNYELSAILIGVMALFKGLPIVYAMIFLGLDLPWKEKLRYILISVVTLGIAHVISNALFQGIAKSYYTLLFGGYSIMDTGRNFNPSIVAMLKDLFHDYWYIAYIPYFIIMTYLIIKVIRSKMPELHKVCFIILYIMCVLFELKKYSYTMAIIPIYFLIKDIDIYSKYVVFIISCIVPTYSWGLYLYFQEAIKGTLLEFFMYWYIILICLIMCYVGLVTKHLYRSIPKEL